ncbi:hypothetical protein [Dipodfec virus UOA04_Rod_565]|nr:hypothetical protein [Dipodfec virus UOA04_Rod_565]
MDFVILKISYMEKTSKKETSKKGEVSVDKDNLIDSVSEAIKRFMKRHEIEERQVTSIKIY